MCLFFFRIQVYFALHNWKQSCLMSGLVTVHLHANEESLNDDKGGGGGRGQEAPSVSVRTWICIRLHTWLCVEEERGSSMDGCSIGRSCSRWRKVGGASFQKSRRWLTAVCAASRARPSRTNLVRFADVWKARNPPQKNGPSRKIWLERESKKKRGWGRWGGLSLFLAQRFCVPNLSH